MAAARPVTTDRVALFAGAGEMGRRIVEHDWRATRLGPIEDWPEPLVNAVSLLLPAGAEIVLFWGPDYIALYNDAYAPTIGDKHPGALGRPARESWSEMWEDLEPLLAHVRTTGETYSAKDRPFYIERAGFGEEVYFDISYSPVRLGDGAIGGVLCIVSETTARVRAARAIDEDRQRLAEMFDSAPSFMAVLRGPTHVFELANRSFLQLIGEDRADPIGQPIREVLPEIGQQAYMTLLDEVFATGQPHRANGADIMLRRAADTQPERRIIDFVFQPITDGAGAVSGVFIEGADVSGRHAAETALDISRESLTMATDAGEIGTWDLDLATGRLDWPARTKAMFGISPDVPCSMEDFYAGLHPDDLAATTTAFEAALDPARRAIYDVEYRAIGAEDGVTRWIAARGRGVFDERGRCVRAIGTTIDISRRKARDEALRESEARFRTLADSLPALVWVSDVEGRTVFANRAFERMLGVSPEAALNGGALQRLHPDDRKLLTTLREHRRAGPRPFGGDVRMIDAEQRTRWIHVEGRPRMSGETFLGYVGCAVDVTDAHLASDALERRIAERTAELTEQIAERRQVEATLHQMQRLEAVGQLTSGVAHDFNNLLTIVLGNIGLVERAIERAGVDGKTLKRIEHVRTAAERGATLTAQLLAFSRRQRLEARAIDLNETVAGMSDLMQSSLGGGIRIETRLADDLWPAMVDPTQIELIILNLAINARDAMAVGGTVTVGTGNVVRGTPEAPEEPAAGDYVMVEVADTGSGMSDETRAKAFEPFFTTKEVGKGSGLGLAQVYGFAKQSGGGVRIDTAPGEGTTVSVFLPRAAEDAVSAGEPRVAKATGSIAGRTVLVLDDEDAVRGVTADELREAGCRVIEAADGASALAALESERGIELVVADFAMPGMNGADFAARAHRRWPALPVVFVTGYADFAAIADVAEAEIIQKPYATGAVVERVRAVLERG